MSRTLARSILFPLFVTTAAAVAQIPGVSATLRAEHEVVPANAAIAMVLTLEVQQDADLPQALLSGVQLDIKHDEEAGQPVREGGEGTVRVAKGTKIERRFEVPADKAMAGAAGRNIVHLEMSWPKLPGASCVVQVAPDPSKYAVEDLDLSKTKVLLATSMGDMTLAFRPDKAPKTVENFITLAHQGFYDGTKFHRVIRDFMIQGGDPNTRDDSKQALWGQGGSGKNLDAEFNDTRHVRGVLSMARGPDVNSASSQFFIVHKDSPHLDKQYTAFGNLEKGADVLDAIATTKTASERPLTPVMLQHAIVLPAYK